MSIPYLKGWGASIKDAAEELTPALKSLKNQNWQQHEALQRELLDPNKLQTYANQYWENPNAFSEADIGKKNLERIKATSQDPTFMNTRIKARAANKWMENPDNQEELQRIATGAEDPTVKQMRILQLGNAKRAEAEALDRAETFNKLPPAIQQRMRTDAVYREKFGMTESQLEMADSMQAEQKRMLGVLGEARSWAEKNGQLLDSPQDLAKALEEGKIPAKTLGALMLDDTYKGVVGLGQKLWMDKINFGQQQALQNASIEAQGTRQDKSLAAQEERLAKTQAAKVFSLEAQLTNRVLQVEKDRKEGKYTSKQMQESVVPALQALANEIAAAKGTTPVQISFDPKSWYQWGKSSLKYSNGGEAVPLNSSTIEGLVTPKPDAAVRPKGATGPARALLPQMEQDFLGLYDKWDLATKNKYYQNATPEQRTLLDKWTKDGYIEDLTKPPEN